MFKIYYCILLFPLCCSIVRAEWYTSFTHMVSLLQEETALANSLRTFIQSERSKLDYLEEILEHINRTTCNRADEPIKCMENPTNQYALISRLVKIWDDVSKAVSDHSTTSSFLWNVDRMRAILPTKQDLVGSINGILRVQKTYDLSAWDVTRGIVGESTSGSALGASDCYDLGDACYGAEEFVICIEWLEVAKYQVEHGDQSVKLEKVLYLLARCAYGFDHLPLAYEVMKEVGRIAPNYVEVASFYNFIIDEAERRNYVPHRGNFQSAFARCVNEKPVRNFSAHEHLCQKTMSSVVQNGSPSSKSLLCYLWDGNRNPHLLIGPIKIEVESEKPYLARFYDFISDSESEKIKEISTPILERAKVINSEGNGEESEYRVTKTIFLERDVEVVDKVITRIADVTGFDMEYGELLSIVNYGIGGHYSVHYDPFGGVADSGPFEAMGDRVATVLLYLSDVEQGGNTVFPDAGIAVKPIKGSAVLWFNLHTDGSVDNKTMHAGCPVLTGEKWIANEWIRQKAISTCLPCRTEECPENTHRMSLNF